MRLIDADALMEYCNNLKDKSIDANDIARFPTAVGWISVDDETPEATEEDAEGAIAISKFVLVYLVYKSGFTFITVDKYRPDMDAWLSDVPGEECRVTHWMPLPEAPEVDHATD